MADFEPPHEALQDKGEHLIGIGDKFYYTNNAGKPREASMLSLVDKNGKIGVNYLVSDSGQVGRATKTLDELLDLNTRNEKDEQMHFSVQIPRSNGQIEVGWAYVGSYQDNDGVIQAKVMKTSGDVGSQTVILDKKVPMADLVRINTSDQK